MYPPGNDRDGPLKTGGRFFCLAGPHCLLCSMPGGPIPSVPPVQTKALSFLSMENWIQNHVGPETPEAHEIKAFVRFLGLIFFSWCDKKAASFMIKMILS